MKTGTIKVNMYQSTYAWIDRGDGIRCGWCDKLKSEIKNPNKHIKEHDRLEKIENLLGGRKIDLGEGVYAVKVH